MNKLPQIRLGPLKGIGPLGDPEEEGIFTFTKFISSVVGIMTVIAIIWFIFVFLSGAYTLISAGGDKAALESGRKKITSGLIGLVVVIAAVFIIDLVGSLLGIPDILNLPVLFQRIDDLL